MLEELNNIRQGDENVDSSATEIEDEDD